MRKYRMVAGGLLVDPLPEPAAPAGIEIPAGIEVPEGIDLTRASAARMYDYYLNGAHNFAIDRTVARKVLELYPNLTLMAQANRAFLHRTVRYLVGQGIRQFIDLGSGIPTTSNVHETAQRDAPETRVLYVDHDPAAVAHTEFLLDGNPLARVLQADLRRPQDILASVELTELIDLSQPVAVLLVAVLHFLSDHDDPEHTIEAFLDAVAPGSYLVVSHLLAEELTPRAEQVRQLYRSTSERLVYRTREQIEQLLTGWDLLEPGLVWIPQWHPAWPDEVGPEPSASGFVGAVATKRAR